MSFYIESKVSAVLSDYRARDNIYTVGLVYLPKIINEDIPDDYIMLFKVIELFDYYNNNALNGRIDFNELRKEILQNFLKKYTNIL